MVLSRWSAVSALAIAGMANGAELELAATAAADPAATPPTLATVTVSASKDERRLEEVPATVTVIDAFQLKQQVVENIGDLVRYEPGVSVPNQGSRFGRSGFTIRGLGGNRVQVGAWQGSERNYQK